MFREIFGSSFPEFIHFLTRSLLICVDNYGVNEFAFIGKVKFSLTSKFYVYGDFKSQA